jgi:cob(I)alamin adenosyltransferase
MEEKRYNQPMSIVTKTGDKGQTGLFGGQRVAKSDVRIHAYGTVDELNATLGLVLAESDLAEILRGQILQTQNLLFRLGADLATPTENNAARVPRIEHEHIQQMEEWITAIEGSMTMPQYFVLPGGSRGASLLHLARTICRRAERWTVELRLRDQTSAETVMYLNRLSDYLFLAALKANEDAGIEHVRVSYE